MRLCLVFLCMAVICGTSANADDLPDPSCCIVTLDETERLLLVPDWGGNPHSRFSVQAINMYNCETPVVNAVVEVVIYSNVDQRTSICDGYLGLVGITDDEGWAHFDVPGGGCAKGETVVVIRINGIDIRQYDAIVSPDYTGWDNIGEPNRWSHTIDPADLAAFVAAYQGGAGPASCHDYDNNGIVDPPDLTVFVSAYKGGSASCIR